MTALPSALDRISEFFCVLGEEKWFIFKSLLSAFYSNHKAVYILNDIKSNNNATHLDFASEKDQRWGRSDKLEKETGKHKQ